MIKVAIFTFLSIGAIAFSRDYVLNPPSTSTSLITALCSLFLFLTVKVEEIESIRKFGEEYVSYMGSTKMFILYVL